MKLPLAFLLSICSSIVFSQNLPVLWKNLKTGSAQERIVASTELRDYYNSENRDTLRVIGEELFFFGIDEHYYPCVEEGKCILSEYYILIGRTAEGISMLKSLISNAEERKDNLKICQISSLLSEGYRQEKDAKSSFYWAEVAVKSGTKCKKPSDRLKGQNSLAEAYLLKKNADQAIKTYEIYIQEAKKINYYRGLSSAYARVGDIYRSKNNLPKATKYFLLSSETAKKVGLTAPTAHAINNLAIVYFETGDTMKALTYFTSALEMRLETADRKAISESYYNLGDFYFYTENIKEAESWYKKSMNFSRKSNLKAELFDAISALAIVAKQQKDFELTIAYLEKAIEVKDQMYIEGLADDEEITKLQQEMFRLETSTPLTMKSQSSFQKYFKIEWLIILFLSLTVLMLIGKRKGKA